MTDEYLIDEISAHLDGESENPAEVDRFLADDFTARGVMDSYIANSRALRGLDAPAISESFTASVMARVWNEAGAIELTQARMKKSRRSRHWVIMAPMAAAAMLLVSVGAWMFWSAKETTVLPEGNHPMIFAGEKPALTGWESAMERLTLEDALMLDAEFQYESALASSLAEEAPPPAAYTAALYDAEGHLIEGLYALGASYEELDDTLTNLDADEAEMFSLLLRQYNWRI